MEHITFEKTDHIGTICLNRAEKHNAFNAKTIAQFSEILDYIETDDTIRVVTLKAHGSSFCAGADIQWMRDMVHYNEQQNLEDSLHLAQLLSKLNHLNKPTIAFVQGACFGGGVGLVACCDMAFALSSATFSLSEVRIGLVPAVVSPYLISAMGARACRRYFTTGELFNAEQAKQLGLISEVFEDVTSLNEFAEKQVQMIFKNSPQAIRESKKLIEHVNGYELNDDLMHHTAQVIANIRVSSEGQEGLNAFLEKRKPFWQGE